MPQVADVQSEGQRLLNLYWSYNEKQQTSTYWQNKQGVQREEERTQELREYKRTSIQDKQQWKGILGKWSVHARQPTWYWSRRKNLHRRRWLMTTNRRSWSMELIQLRRWDRKTFQSCCICIWVTNELRRAGWPVNNRFLGFSPASWWSRTAWRWLFGSLRRHPKVSCTCHYPPSKLKREKLRRNPWADIHKRRGWHFIWWTSRGPVDSWAN